MPRCLRLEQVFDSTGPQSRFSQPMARDQGFKVNYDDDNAMYTLFKNLATALHDPLRAECGL
ncbi:hypothetical protein GN244_ATG01423 [Phytophthora infestans]|uniref:Uncharacterized protein n=1 Tax=Phytophthora infestans TaxID=4787 RepID=A0A833TN82_PHYIN|nr:hypothetical protein GN244_ATG01423 [Phytophthora infestans]KAF4136188.1 hypothetical protein GN958_ATG14628 [Phytophthora infestans]